MCPSGATYLPIKNPTWCVDLEQINVRENRRAIKNGISRETGNTWYKDKE